MKKLLYLFLIPIFIQCSCKQNIVDNELIISQKNENINGIQFRIKRVFDDSRCPTDVDCIRAGEVSVQFEVLENKVLKETKTMTFNSKNTAENTAWFATYFKDKIIKNAYVLPTPESGKTIKPEDYFIKISFE